MTDGGAPRDKLDKLLPKTLTAKRRQRKDRKAAEAGTLNAPGGDDEGRGRSLSPVPSFTFRGRRGSSLMDSEDGTSSPNGDDASIGDRSRSTNSHGGSLTEQSMEVESSKGHPEESSPIERPAPISTHPSLIGYLTTSSPVVQAEHLDSQHPDIDSASAALSSLASNDDIPSTAPLEPPLIAPPNPAKIPSTTRKAKPKIGVETRPPRTPPGSDQATPAPAIVNTPPTPVEAQTAKAFGTDWKAPWRGSSPPPSADGSSPKRNMSAHRHSRSGSINHGPSKLSTITSAPLSPPPEGPETSLDAQNNSGFFSSMFSAAQSAANNISSNIQNSGINLGPNKSKATASVKSQISPSPSHTSVGEPEVTGPTLKDIPSMEKKEASIRSIGSGDLSLSALGLAEPAKSDASALSKFPELSDQRARSESAPVDSQVSSVDLTAEGTTSRPRSLHEPVPGGVDHSPAHSDIVDDKLGLHRKSSLRSASKTHRKRGSSVATTGTGTTIGAAIAAATTSLANPAAAPGAPKLTGFAIASKKRNRDFHNIFKSVPDDDYLIEDYSCALQREILAHGRLYVSEGHLCFSSNILGWSTTLVMSFDEIVSVEKRSTALLFKNGLMISTLHAKHIFASFTSRDATYDLIVNIWKLGHPTLTSTLNGVRLEGTGGDKTERPDNENASPGNGSHAESEVDGSSDEDDSDEYDSDGDEEGSGFHLADSTISAGEPEKIVTRKASGSSPTNNIPAGPIKDTVAAPSGEQDFPGPTTHAPTDCGDTASHYDKIVGDEIIPAPLGKVYNLLFGPPSAPFMGKWLTGEQKCFDLQMEDKKGLIMDNKTRTYSYIKPLGGSIGPKQTKCIVTETLENLDLEKSANFNVSTQTPDVPSGNVFVIKTRYCLSWAENNATRLQMNCAVEWSGKSWLKGPIEKGANDGQTQYCKDLCAALRAAVSSKPRAVAMNNGAGRTKKKGRRSKAHRPSDDTAEGRSAPKGATKQDWGLLEPIRQIFEPIVDILQPLFTGNVMYGLLVGLLVATWFGFGFPSGRNGSRCDHHSHLGVYSPDRLAAYEEMWRREESELWEWLEERVGVDQLQAHGGRASSASASATVKRKKPIEARTLEEKIREEKMEERLVEEAIRITEEKLEVLRGAMTREKGEPAAAQVLKEEL